MKILTFFTCGLDCRVAKCECRHVDEHGNQPLALCEASTKRKAIKGSGDFIRIFDLDCVYRGEFKVNLTEAGDSEKEVGAEPQVIPAATKPVA